MTQDKGSNRRIEREPEDPAASGVNEDSRGTVEDVAGCKLTTPRLQDGFDAGWRRVALASIDGENCADVHVHIDVGRSIKRVEDDDVFPRVRLPAESDRLVVLFRNQCRDRLADAKAVQQRFIRIDVKLLLGLALDIGLPGGPQDITQARATDLGFNHFRGKGNSRKKPGEVPRSVRNFTLLLQYVLLKGRNHRMLSPCMYLEVAKVLDGPTRAPRFALIHE